MFRKSRRSSTPVAVTVPSHDLLSLLDEEWSMPTAKPQEVLKDSVGYGNLQEARPFQGSPPSSVGNTPVADKAQSTPELSPPLDVPRSPVFPESPHTDPNVENSHDDSTPPRSPTLSTESATYTLSTSGEADEVADLLQAASTESPSSSAGTNESDERDADRDSCYSQASSSGWSTAYTTWPSSLHSTSSFFIGSLKRGGGDLSSLLLWSFLLLPVTPLILISLPFCLLILTLLIVGAALAYTSFAGTCIGCATILSPFRRKLPEPGHVRLADGRRLAFQESGVPRESARHTILVFHAPPLCRTAGLPGLSEAFFHQRSIRVISFDLPGTGFSDPLPLQATTTTASFATAVADDIKQLVQQLHVAPALWIVGFGLGCPLAEAAAEKLGQALVSGVLLLGPPGVSSTAEGGDSQVNSTGGGIGLRNESNNAQMEDEGMGAREQPEVVMPRQRAGGVWQLVQQSFRGWLASTVMRIVVPRVLVQSVVALLRTSPVVLRWIVNATSLRPMSPRVVSLICDGLLDTLQQGDLPYLLHLLVLTLQPHGIQPYQGGETSLRFSGPVYTYKVFDEPMSQNLLAEAMFQG